MNTKNRCSQFQDCINNNEKYLLTFGEWPTRAFRTLLEGKFWRHSFMSRTRIATNISAKSQTAHLKAAGALGIVCNSDIQVCSCLSRVSCQIENRFQTKLYGRKMQECLHQSSRQKAIGCKDNAGEWFSQRKRSNGWEIELKYSSSEKCGWPPLCKSGTLLTL